MRARSVSDERILDAVRMLLCTRGAAALTLDAIGREVGLAPPTLLQRFGARERLIQAFVRREGSRVRQRFGAARQGATTPLQALRDAARGPDSTEAVRAAAVLATGLDHPGTHPIMLVMREEIEALVDEAMAFGEIRSGDPAAVAAALHALICGLALLPGAAAFPTADDELLDRALLSMVRGWL